MKEEERFARFFQRVTRVKGFEPYPYPYQIRLATERVRSRALHIPTGAGKTAAAVVAWLWRRKEEPEWTPRRLVYCLPMRVLVEQTRNHAKKWVEEAKKAGLDEDIGVYTLMGGEVEEKWEVYPEKPAILVGTQDMLLSRALNRGYAMSRYRWPVHFGLLNNDCLWVCDEVQLMGSGLGTTTQLQGFREDFGICGPAATWWMSATMDRRWLETVDFAEAAVELPVEGLKSDDLEDADLKRRYTAPKPMSKLPEMTEAALGARVLSEHERGSLTLVVVNSVERAQKIYEEVKKGIRKKRARAPEVILAHSRFRVAERGWISERVQSRIDEEGEGRIVVATQVIEAGVDISARTLISELAPWGSMVQRFGRCNRKGEYKKDEAPARIYWIDLPNKKAKPYTEEELDSARRLLSGLEDAAIGRLTEIGRATRKAPWHVVRKKDLLELFDTTPDLSGGDIDVSRYIREEEELDAEVFWRPVSEGGPGKDEAQPGPEELCAVPFYLLNEYLKLEGRVAFRWNALEGRWVKATAAIAGQAYLLDAAKGGYSAELGWSTRLGGAVEILEGGGEPEESYDADRYATGKWLTIAEHSENVARLAEEVMNATTLEGGAKGAVRTAVRWHDRGKAHVVFQRAVPGTAPQQRGDWAKAPGRFRRYDRRHFRHELASALAILQAGSELISADVRDLAAYLAAAHHGRVRLSIRSLPNETAPEASGKRRARGIWEDDTLSATDLGRDVLAPEVRLSLEPMEMGLEADGDPSWVERMLRLRNAPELGPFRLAFLEALVRAADRRASAAEIDGDA